MRYHRETHHSKCSKCLLLAFEIHNKTILSLIYGLINEALLVADHILIRCHFSSWTYLAGFWQTCSCVSVLVGVSRRWCAGVVFMQPEVKVNGAYHYYSDVLLLKQLLPYICQAAGDFYFPAHHACTRAPSCCDTTLRTSLQTCGLPIDQTCCRLQDMDSHSGMHLSETASVVIHHR